MNCGSCPRKHLTRRQLLKLSSKSVSTLVFACPTFSLLASCSQSPLGSPLGAGPSITIPTSSNGVYTFLFTAFPQLQNTGGSIHVTIQAASGAKDVFITRVDASTVDTVSTVCTHAGCTLDAFNTSTQQYFCSCHGSVFAVDGSVITGPATVPLPTYASVVASDSVQVTVP